MFDETEMRKVVSDKVSVLKAENRDERQVESTDALLADYVVRFH